MPTLISKPFPDNNVQAGEQQETNSLPRQLTSVQSELEPAERIQNSRTTPEVSADSGQIAPILVDPNITTRPSLLVDTDLLKGNQAEVDIDPGSSPEGSQMKRKTHKLPSNEPLQPESTASGGQNGFINDEMESHMRRKHSSLESPTAATQTAHLMSREDFTLDDEPPPTPLSANSNASFFQLPAQDRRNFLQLVLLYFLQGIPMGLAMGSIPIILKKHLSYSQIGVFSLAAYPYSLKLLWSPIVDAVWSPHIGRRKSWILPIQTCSGLGMIYLGGQIKNMMVAAEAKDGSGIWSFTWWWFFLVFLCATQDIAVDGIWKFSPEIA